MWIIFKLKHFYKVANITSSVLYYHGMESKSIIFDNRIPAKKIDAGVDVIFRIPRVFILSVLVIFIIFFIFFSYIILTGYLPFVQSINRESTSSISVKGY